MVDITGTGFVYKSGVAAGEALTLLEGTGVNSNAAIAPNQEIPIVVTLSGASSATATTHTIYGLPEADVAGAWPISAKFTGGDEITVLVVNRGITEIASAGVTITANAVKKPS